MSSFGVFLREYGINEERGRSFYENVLAHLIAACVQRGDTVVDCGANAGRHTFNFLRALGGVGTCVAIEPNPAMVEVLRSRLHGHVFAGNVDLKTVAVGARAGSATFNVFDAKPALSRMTTTWQPPGYEGRTITVDVVPLDDMAIQSRPSVRVF